MIYIIEYSHDELQAPNVWKAETPDAVVRAIQCALELPMHPMSLQQALDANEETLSAQTVIMSDAHAQEALAMPGTFRDIRAHGMLDAMLRPVRVLAVSDTGLQYTTDLQPPVRGESMMAGVKRTLAELEEWNAAERFRTAFDIPTGTGATYSQMLQQLGWTPPSDTPGLFVDIETAELIADWVKCPHRIHSMDEIRIAQKFLADVAILREQKKEESNGG